MAEYNRWMNLRLYDATAKLPDTALFQDRQAFFGSLFNTMNHIAVADLIWLHRFAQHPELTELGPSLLGLPNPTSLRERLVNSLSEMREVRIRIDEVITLLAGLVNEEHLSQTIRYSNTSGQIQRKNFGLLLQHLFSHQTHHRGQASTLLFQAGVDIGVTDLNALIASET